MAGRPDLLWIHGAGVVRDGYAVLIAGPGGCGKSTLATRLAARGFSYMGDDVLPIDLETGDLHPFPVTPSVRTSAGRMVPEREVRVLLRKQVLVDAARVASGAAPVGLLVFPTFGLTAPTGASSCPPAQATLKLLGQCLNFGRHRENAIRVVSRLMPGWPAMSLGFDDPDRAADLVAQVHVAAADRAVVS